MQQRIAPFVPGILIFIAALLCSLLTYQDYGISWDETYQRGFGVLSYDYITGKSTELLKQGVDHHGSAFELLLYIPERLFSFKSDRDIYLMRHLVCHVFFLLACFSGYVLAYRLYKNRLIAAIGMLMLLLMPRIYAHAYFNTKDVPFVSMTLLLLAVCEPAFRLRSLWRWVLLGMLCGLAIGTRITGVIFFVLFFACFLIDIATGIRSRRSYTTTLAGLLLFTTAIVLMLYAGWPYLWAAPVSNLVESFGAMAHFNWPGNILFAGGPVSALHLPWYYFPVWFGISTPLVWLLAGLGGLCVLTVRVVYRMKLFALQHEHRMQLLFLLSFIIPVVAVICLHSVIYDDWRHLYFVYPPFVFMGLYLLNEARKTKLYYPAIAICLVQAGCTVYFMVANHPFQQVYFNALVSHDKEYLRKNFELEYWGCGFKQGLEYILHNDNREVITIASANEPLTNNMLLLDDRDRQRIHIVDKDADYAISNFRAVPLSTSDLYTPVYSVKVLNSTILAVYKFH